MTGKTVDSKKNGIRSSHLIENCVSGSALLDKRQRITCRGYVTQLRSRYKTCQKLNMKADQPLIYCATKHVQNYSVGILHHVALQCLLVLDFMLALVLQRVWV